MARIILLALCLTVISAKGQQAAPQNTFSGLVTDHSTGLPVPYASVGIKGTPFGTVCDEQGIFRLTAKNLKGADSLKISSIGYEPVMISLQKAGSPAGGKIELKPLLLNLSEVVIKPGKTQRVILGNKHYNKNVYCSFTGMEGNYKSTEAAIMAKNKKNRMVWIDDFNFYILKNLFTDSIAFRLNFYSELPNGMPGENILRSPVVFKTKTKEGIVHVDLQKYNITATGNFFISLECLTDNMSKEMLNFSGSIRGPAYFKIAAAGDWYKSPLMGLDFNVTASYKK